jgi:hypothetical protein
MAAVNKMIANEAAVVPAALGPAASVGPAAMAHARPATLKRQSA